MPTPAGNGSGSSTAHNVDVDYVDLSSSMQRLDPTNFRHGNHDKHEHHNLVWRSPGACT
jgi:hypothetical protein